MDRFSGLCDELLVKILSSLSTKVAVSTSVLSKRWEFLWMWLPKLDYMTDFRDPNPALGGFISKNLPLHRAQVIESLRLKSCCISFPPEDVKLWIGIAVSRCLRELSILYLSFNVETHLSLPSSLFTCKSLATLRLKGMILVDVPRTVSLPSLKTLHLGEVKFSNEASLRLLLSYSPVLEDLVIEIDGDDHVKSLVVIVPSLQRLTLKIGLGSSSDGYVIVTPSLKYFKVEDDRESYSYLIERMPKLEEAYIDVLQDLEKLLEAVTCVKRLSLRRLLYSRDETVYRAGVVFNQLEHLKLGLCNDYWSMLLVRLLKDSPKLRVLSLYVHDPCFEGYERIRWDDKQSSVPKCLLKSLETFEFKGYMGRPEERDFLGFLFRNARCLKSTSILR
ncbi:unnamed protein product [Microthlaspi erraticum]|uniref:Uncharacterized protein n=1 Tax=Microthlaspi erraticum TaxID=1685480 RepID=A0A6D2L9G7_9BRAS|nr:unnamed protein product [Microthlaspi erraticum]